jgi:hypothetical protein
MYELSLLCVDRTFLLISWDPSCVNAGNMPFPLVVRSLDRALFFESEVVHYECTIEI